jgi:hypothetical protein
VDDIKAIESLTHEMGLTRHEMAALTDSMNPSLPTCVRHRSPGSLV